MYHTHCIPVHNLLIDVGERNTGGTVAVHMPVAPEGGGGPDGADIGHDVPAGARSPFHGTDGGRGAVDHHVGPGRHARCAVGPGNLTNDCNYKNYN